ncbi:MAG: RIP metalloprotease RseP [Proteobacteria bacterium]|nr:RIP metalloprotease RseP [Pseudomonadota bacterium]MBU4472493.1 RIP metalloprotease RseP [Pseudomonadota bacterium]MCG2751319.1 RIP metalloprotease RseP [Desulfobacteraceae bacterium]
MSYFISFIIVLGVLVFFHELGHFLLARLCGVGVEKFSLGFGPRIVGKTIGITDYRISAIPLGGYVKMIGEEPGADIDPKDIPLSFTHKSVWKRFLIVAAGPAFNILLAVAIYFCFFQIYGMTRIEPVIGSVMEKSPAQAAGLQKGDRILAIQNRTMDTFDQMAIAITESQGKPITFTVKRDEATFDVKITPGKEEKTMFGETVDTFLIGVASSPAHVQYLKLNPLQALSQSFVQTWQISRLMFVGIVQMIKGEVSAKNLGGPIMIAQMAGDQAKQGPLNLIYFIAFISINLAILNFLPIPVLDGGHLFFFIIEAFTGKPVNLKVRETAQQVGIFVLMALVVFVFYNDITRLIF